MKKVKLDRIVLAGILFIITGIFTFTPFRSLPSIGIGLVFLVSLFYIKNTPLTFTNFPILVPSGVFFICLLSCFLPKYYNWTSASEELLLKLPFLLLAWAFFILPSITEELLLRLYYYFFILVVLTALGTTINFLIHFKEITESYIHSKVMPTPVNHVRYSLIVAFATFTGGYLYFRKFYVRYPGERWFLLISTIFLFLFLHILSVRSGMLALYVVIAVVLGWLALTKKKYLLVTGALAGIVLLPLIAYFTVPTFRNKVYNTAEDLRRLGDARSANFYSLSGRVLSYQVAWKIFTQHPLTGVGVANLGDEVEKTYTQYFPEVTDEGVGMLMPHNQFLNLLAATGILGTAIFCFCFYFPVFYRNYYRIPLLWSHYTIITVSFLFEATLETQTGSVFTIIFLFLPLYYLKDKPVTS